MGGTEVFPSNSCSLLMDVVKVAMVIGPTSLEALVLGESISIAGSSP
jgi:hypothetical protein